MTQAGAHPDGTTAFWFNRNTEGIGADAGFVDGSVDNIVVDLPPGFVANPNAVAKCSAEEFNAYPLECPPESQVGVLHLNIQAAFGGGANLLFSNERIYPVYNLEPRRGRAAEIGFGYASGENATTVRLIGKARTNGDYGVTAFAGQIPAALPPVSQAITIWGIPWAAANDPWRAPLGLDPTSDDPAVEACMVQPGTDPSTDGSTYIPAGGLLTQCQAKYQPAWGDTPPKRAVSPFISNETDCNPSPTVKLAMDAYQRPGSFTAEDDPDLSDADWKTYVSASPAVTGCADLDFAPDISFEPTSSAADDSTGLKVELSVPQNNDPKDGGGAPLDPPDEGASQTEIDDYVQTATDYWNSPEGRATAHLKDTVVTLPPGVGVNPSGATGLQACSDAQIGYLPNHVPKHFNNEDPFDDEGADCPDGSVIGTAEVRTPLLDETLTGQVVLGEPKSTDPQSGEMFRLFIVVRNEERGLLAKIFGSTKADPGNGRLTTTFLDNPELPFDSLSLEIKGGPRGLLRMPPRCGPAGWSSTFTPWSAAFGGGGQSVDDAGAIGVNSRCAEPFAPALTAGMSARQARGSGQFSFQFTRPDGPAWVQGLTAHLPTGLLASVRDVPLCTNAQAAANACPAGSRIGSVDASAGSGDPFVLERKGDVYLTEGYKGAPYGLAVSVPVEAGPFRGPLALSPVVVRQALHVDRRTAQVTAVSDPLPLVHHGIVLGVRRVTVTVDRPDFMLNPSDCSPKSIGVTFAGSNGESSTADMPFNVSDCAALRFKPRLNLRLTGRRQVRTGRHPGVRAVVRQQGIKEAGIAKAEVRLPKSLALDPDNAQALCEFDDGTKPDLENHCPKGSIVGRARATSPLLNDPLVGNVYFVKNVRRSSSGNLIRTLPMIIVALRGEIAVNLVGESSTTRSGKLVNTFDDVPDAPISRFNLNIKGGKNGILAVTRTRRSLINLCARPKSHVAEADMDGQNGRRHDFDVRMKTPCSKRQTRAARKAKRAAAKRAARLR